MPCRQSGRRNSRMDAAIDHGGTFPATRLLPIGQTDAQSLLWDLADDISAVSQSLCCIEALSVPSFAPALDIACMTHPALETRLFIS